MPLSWRGHRTGQSTCMHLDTVEGARPFTIASAPHVLGNRPDDKPLLRMAIKPLADYTRLVSCSGACSANFCHALTY